MNKAPSKVSNKRNKTPVILFSNNCPRCLRSTSASPSSSKTNAFHCEADDRTSVSRSSSCATVEPSSANDKEYKGRPNFLAIASTDNVLPVTMAMGMVMVMVPSNGFTCSWSAIKEKQNATAFGIYDITITITRTLYCGCLGFGSVACRR